MQSTAHARGGRSCALRTRQTLKTGDTLAIDGAAWRVRSAHERPPLAWAVDCMRIG